VDPEHLSWLGLAATAGAAASRVIAVEFRKARRDRFVLRDVPPEYLKDALEGLASVAEAEQPQIFRRQRPPGSALTVLMVIRTDDPLTGGTGCSMMRDRNRIF
jgi:hypothetical protein